MVAGDGCVAWRDVVVRVGRLGMGQSYARGTNVLRTLLPDATVIDVLPWHGDSLRPDGRLVRLVDGEATIVVEPVHPGARVARFSGGVAFDDTVVWTVPADGRTVVVVGGEPESLDGAMDLLDRTERAWRSWLRPLAYDGAFLDVVERSSLAVKATPFDAVPAVAMAARLFRRVGFEEEAEGLRARLRVRLADNAVELPDLLAAAPDIAHALDGDVPAAVADRWADEWREAERPRERLGVAVALRRVADVAFARNPLDLAAAAWRAEAIDIEREVAAPEPGIVELAAAGRWDDAHQLMEELVRTLSPLGLVATPPDVCAQLAVVDAAVYLAAGPR